MQMRGITLGCAMLVMAGSALAQPSSPFGAPISELGGAEMRNHDWFGFGDYPASAVRQNLEGRVVIAFEITIEGRATNCRVVESSGHAMLDRAPCRPLERKARFTPAMKDGVAFPTEGKINIDFWVPRSSR